MKNRGQDRTKGKGRYAPRSSLSALRFTLSAFGILLFVLSGCASVREAEEAAVQEPNQGQVSIFLRGPDRSSSDVTFELAAVNIIGEDGAYREIMNVPLAINSLAAKGRQMLLGERMIPEGTYKKIQLIVKGASIKRKDRTASLALPPEGMEIEIKFTVYRGRNTSLFLNWDADASITEGYLFRPVFLARGQVPELSSLLVYVSNEDSNNVSVINRQSGEVVGTILGGKRPRGIAVGTRKDALKVYVVNSGSNSISVINPTTNLVETEIPVRFGWGTEAVAVARITAEKELILVTNYSSNTVSVFDGQTYQEIESINVGKGPTSIAAEPPIDSISGTRSLSSDDFNTLKSYREKFLNVYVTNRNSKDVSVIKIDLSTGRSVEVTSLGVEWNPMAVGLDYQRGKAYVANYDSDKLSVIDIPKFVRGGKSDAVSTINNVGVSGIGIIADPSFERIYFLREMNSDVVVIRPPSSGTDTSRAVITPVIDVVPVGNSPRSLLIDPEARKLYIVNRGANNVSVIDKTTRRIEQAIPVGKRPYGIAMFPQ